MSCGELYTVVTNRVGRGGKSTLVAMIRGTKSEDVIKVLEMIHVSKRKTVKEVTLDLSPTMMRMAIPVSSCWQGLNMYLSSILVNGLNPKEYVRKSYNFFPEMNKSVS